MAKTLRLDDETQAMLDALVASEGASGNEVIKRAIRDRAQRAGLAARAIDAFADAETEWADVLEKLARV